jgi:hypothetical protein
MTFALDARTVRSQLRPAGVLVMADDAQRAAPAQPSARIVAVLRRLLEGLSAPAPSCTHGGWYV